MNAQIKRKNRQGGQERLESSRGSRRTHDQEWPTGVSSHGRSPEYDEREARRLEHREQIKSCETGTSIDSATPEPGKRK